MNDHHRDDYHRENRPRDPAGPAATRWRAGDEELVDVADAAALAALRERAPGIVAVLEELLGLGETVEAVEQRLLRMETCTATLRLYVATAYEHLIRQRPRR